MYHFRQKDTTEQSLKVIAKRRNLYTILWAVSLVIGGTCGVIPAVGWYLSMAMMFLWGVFAGLGMVCINHYRFIKSEGRKQGGGLWWFMLFILGLIIIPVLTVWICNRSAKIVSKIIGVDVV